MLGLISILAVKLEKKADLDILHKASGILESLLNLIDREEDMLTLISAARDIVINSPAKKKRTKTKTKTTRKMKTIVIKDGVLDESQLEDLPDYVREDILAEIAKISK